jgi:hypothetical protein
VNFLDADGLACKTVPIFFLAQTDVATMCNDDRSVVEWVVDESDDSGGHGGASRCETAPRFGINKVAQRSDLGEMKEPELWKYFCGRDAYRRRRQSFFVSQARCRCERSRRPHQLSLLVHAARRHGQDRPRRNASRKAKVTGSAARALRTPRITSVVN